MHKRQPQVLGSIGFIAIILLLSAGPALAFSFPGFGKIQAVTAVNGAVAIPAASVADGKAHFYRFADDGKEIGFFVVKGTDGVFHVAFDACDVCFAEKQGYVQDGEAMVCRNCNKKFATNRIGKANTGGCNPSHLDFAQVNGNLVIRADSLKAGARFF